MPTMQVHARIMLPDGVQADQVDRALWRATPDELRAAIPDVRAVLAITSVLHNPADGLIYLGLTDHDNELLWTYDPATGGFAQRHFVEVAEKYDVKIHRSFALDPADGSLYTASAGLHDERYYLDAPGGKIFRHDPAADRTERLAIPVPHEYIQTICLDPVRRIIYGHCYPTPQMFAYHLDRDETVPLGRGTLPHRAGCDARGNLWGTVGAHQPTVFRYNPEDGMQVTDLLMPELNGSVQAMNVIYQAPDEELCYIGTSGGALMALDTEAVRFDYLGKPMMDSRIEGLGVGNDGLLYGCGGWYGTEVFAYDREARRFWNLGAIADPDLDIRCIIPHDMTIDDEGTIWTGETDMTGRSTAALWECRPQW